MDEQPTVEVSLRIVPGSDPIKGSLDDGGGQPQHYVGWIELIAAVDDAHQRALPEAASEKSGGRP